MSLLNLVLLLSGSTNSGTGASKGEVSPSFLKLPLRVSLLFRVEENLTPKNRTQEKNAHSLLLFGYFIG